MDLYNHEYRTSDHPRKFKNVFLLKCLKYVPAITLIITILVFIWTVWILFKIQKDTFVFIFLSAEVYINWIAILFSRTKLETPVKTQTTMTNSSVTLQRVWFCTKCRLDTFYECHHCPLCEVCIVQRDHHCFFLGTCITRLNMKHFIIFCMYAASSCFYTSNAIISNVNLKQPSQYFLPVAMGHFLAGGFDFITLFQVLVLDIILSVGFLTSCFGLYQIAVVCLAKLPYSSDIEKDNGKIKNLLCAFGGPYGLINFLLPISLSCSNKNRLQSNKLV